MAKLVKIESAADMLFTPPAGYITSTIGTDEAGNITELVKKSDGTFGTIGGGGGSADGYVAIEVDGVLKAQKLAFDGTTASASGDPEAIGTVGIFNTGKDEPAYKGMGGGVFYKCASVDSTAKTWTGYEAIVNGDTGVWSFSETVTAGLTYNKLIPQVGKVYDNECTFQASGFQTNMPTDGLVFYASLASVSDTAETGQALSYSGAYSSTIFNGIPCIELTNGTVEIQNSAQTLETFCACLWANMKDTSGWQNLFGTGNNDNLNIAIDNGKFVCWGGAYTIGGSTTINTNVWYFLCACYSEGALHLYINNVEDYNGEYTKSMAISSNLKIGRSSDNSNAYIAGVRLYNRVLTDDEILALSKEFTPTA